MKDFFKWWENQGNNIPVVILTFFTLLGFVLTYLMVLGNLLAEEAYFLAFLWFPGLTTIGLVVLYVNREKDNDNHG